MRPEIAVIILSCPTSLVQLRRRSEKDEQAQPEVVEETHEDEDDRKELADACSDSGRTRAIYERGKNAGQDPSAIHRKCRQQIENRKYQIGQN